MIRVTPTVLECRIYCTLTPVLLPNRCTEGAPTHRRRIKIEEKEKVRRFCLGGRIYSITCLAGCFALDDLSFRMTCKTKSGKKRMNSSYSSKSSIYQIASAARNLLNYPPPPPTEVTTFAFSSVFILRLWLHLHRFDRKTIVS